MKEKLSLSLEDLEMLVEKIRAAEKAKAKKAKKTDIVEEVGKGIGKGLRGITKLFTKASDALTNNKLIKTIKEEVTKK